ncbi:PLP-dependent transferase [Halovulum dunhuangense]|uniref:PLP-dependent transferase n=1 Tax=Halovulum dunhuangense TaxID=1505036 RepID=A0A849L2J0_9RHOB|nr:PLP-dependent aspartate aminotransferase family protein [Halovulum dunhuangense]NNU80483.1 PLP-dependent transferase [Halovulum dunhuangense]
MTQSRRNAPLSPATRAAQALRHIDPVTGSVTPAIDLSSTFARDADYAPRQRYIYGRDGGPTVEHAEAVIADLDGAARTLLFASGMAAIAAMLETLRAGDHVAAPRVMYHGGQTWLHRVAERRGIEVTFYDQADPEGPKAALRAGQSRILWIETPANPNWDIVDIEAAAKAAHDAGALLFADCTAAPPCTLQALRLGADVAFHSATKYMGGHSDLTAGALSLAVDGDLAAELRQVRSLMGSVIAAFEAWLLIRGLRTLFLRWEKASSNAMAIAHAMVGHPNVAQVLYPGLPDHPGHAIARAQMQGGFGGMLSLMVTGDGSIARDVARFTEVFIPATSLGGVESLIEHRKAVEGPYSIVPPQLLRLSVGIEDAADLIADLTQALERAG